MSDKNEVIVACRFDTGGKIEEIRKALEDLENRGVTGFHLSQKEYQMLKQIERDWFDLERQCDVHNVGEAFLLLSEAETERERKKYASYMKGVMKSLYGSNGTKPIVWKKEWDA